MQQSNALNTISTANVADAHDHLGFVCKWLTRDLTPTKRDKFFGIADVVQWGPTRKTGDIRAAGPSTWDEVGHFVSQIERADPPRVYVAGCKDISQDYVLLGGISMTYLDTLGYAGAVSFGKIRDYDDATLLNMPVWSSGFAVMDSQGCMKVESRGTSCTVAGHVIHQGDLIIGDGNGVVAIDAQMVEQIVVKACEIVEVEDRVMSRIKAGEDLFTLLTADDRTHI